MAAKLLKLDDWKYLKDFVHWGHEGGCVFGFHLNLSC